MGINSVIGIVKAFAKTNTPLLYDGAKYTKRAAKVYLPVVFGDGHEVVSNAYKANVGTKNIFKKEFWTGLWKGTKDAGKAAEAYSAQIGGNKGFFKNAWKSIQGFPKAVCETFKEGQGIAKAAGKSGLLGGLKGVFKGIGKRLPGIGSILMIAFELPNIIKATKEKGIGQGIKETLKAAVRIGAFTLGTIIGTAVGGPLVGIAVGIGADWLAGKIVGKSYTEKAAEEAEKLAENNVSLQGNPQEAAQIQFQSNPFAQQNIRYNTDPLNEDIMYANHQQQLGQLRQQKLDCKA